MEIDDISIGVHDHDRICAWLSILLLILSLHEALRYSRREVLPFIYSHVSRGSFYLVIF